MKAIRGVEDGVLVDIEVSPGSSGFSISSYNTWRNRIEIRIRAIPQKGKANQEIIQEFSHLTQKKVEIVAGHKSRQKTIKIFDTPENEINRIITEFLS